MSELLTVDILEQPKPRKGRVDIALIRCAACGTRLVVGSADDNAQRAVALAYRNAVARPCCLAWLDA